ncbi:MAG: haloacid dehalogenase, partial [Gammaproteobacteria bacterium]|nr:haloacid dehalogenase [Gammaproteobacteria bacterium]
DLQVITSPIQSVLVANTSDEVRNLALEQTQQQGLEDTLYIALGDFYGMNGNYSAGIIEGLAHFIPETEQWIADLI